MDLKNPKYAPCPLLVNMVRAGKLGVKSGEGFPTAKAKKAEKFLNNLSSLKNPRAARTKNGICCSCAKRNPLWQK
jgi:3-hydroxyacyl-CoA dehydrogenase